MVGSNIDKTMEKTLKRNSGILRKNLALVMIFGALIAVSVPVISVQQVFAHGGHQPPAADFGDRKVSLFVKLDPPVITSVGDPVTISARLFDENTNENFKAVSYRIYFHKDGQLIRSSEQIFYDKEGDLQIKLVPKEQEIVQVSGDREVQFGGVYNVAGGPVLMEGPIFIEPGLYNLFIEIVTVDTTRTQVEPPIQYDIWVTPGREEVIPVSTAEGDTFDIRIRNYYGSIEQSTYDAEQKTIQFSMPFSWDDKSFLSKVGMLHTEMFIPRALADFDKPNLFGKVNGQAVPVLVDPHSEHENIVVHFTVSHRNLISIANAIGNDTGAVRDKVVFSLTPPTSEDQIIPSVENVGDSENYRVAITWPSEIDQGKPVTFGVKVLDKSGKVIPNATYELVILKDDQTVERKGGITTPEGIGSQDVTFDSTGSFVIRVEKVNASPESVSLAIQVVPEFGALVYVILAITIGAILLVSRTSLAKGSVMP